MNRLMLAVMGLAVGVLGGLWFYSVFLVRPVSIEQPQPLSVYQVKSICDKAHREVNGTSEEACGNAQDITGTEYICENNTPDADCWVEVK